MTTTIATSLLAGVELWIHDDAGRKFHCRGSYPESPPEAMEHPLLQAAITQRRSALRSVDEQTIEMALPLPITSEVVGAVLFVLRSKGEAPFAVERWCRTEREELGLSEAAYRGLERIERISPYVKFPRGSGLPGQVWDSRQPKIIPQLDQSKAFMRAAAARKIGLRYGLGIPVMNTEHELESVLVVLSTVHCPFALAAESWSTPDDGGQSTLLQSCYADDIVPPESTTCGYGEGLVGECFASRVPLFVTHAESDHRTSALLQQGARFAMALPIFNGDRLVSVWTLLA